MSNHNLTAPNTLSVRAWTYLDRPAGVEFSAKVATREEAEALAALFPKAHLFRVVEVFGIGADYKATGGIAYYYVYSKTKLAAVKGNSANETGVKRYRAIMARAAKVGVAVEWQGSIHGYETRESFEAAL
jgi:hypothetical protein